MGVQVKVPNLVLAQGVIDKITNAAQQYIEDETGEAMIGLVIENNGMPTIYVLDTISPDETAIRQLHTFQQGDDRQDEIIHWLRENWRIQRVKRRDSYGNAMQAKWDAPLQFLGDWHKQPGYMIQPSGGDLMTAVNWLQDTDTMDFLLVPIVTLGHPPTIDDSFPTGNFVTMPMDDGSTYMRIDWWYIHKDAPMFFPIMPAIYPNDQLPRLTPYPWHLINEQRLLDELDQFESNNMFTSISLFDSDDKLPLEVCITAARMGASKIFLIGTSWDHPRTAPSVRLTSFRSLEEGQTIADVFGEWWADGDPVKPPDGWEWSEEKMLYDYVVAVEKAHDLHSTEDSSS